MKTQKGLLNRIFSWVKRHPYISSAVGALTLAGAAAAYKWKDIYYAGFRYFHPKITIADIEKDNEKLNISNVYLHMQTPRFKFTTKSGGTIDLLFDVKYEFNTRTFFDDYFTLAVDSSDLSPQEKKNFSQLESLIEGQDLIFESRQKIADFLAENSPKMQKLLSEICEQPSLDELKAFLDSYKRWDSANLGCEITFQPFDQYNPIPTDSKKNKLDELIEKTVGSYDAAYSYRKLCNSNEADKAFRMFVEQEHQQKFHDFVLNKAQELNQKAIQKIYDKDRLESIDGQALSEMTPRQAALFSAKLTNKLIRFKPFLMPDSLYQTITKTRQGNCLIYAETASAIFSILKEINPNLTHTHLLVGGCFQQNTNPYERNSKGEMLNSVYHSYNILVQTDQKKISFLDNTAYDSGRPLNGKDTIFFIPYCTSSNPNIYKTF